MAKTTMQQELERLRAEVAALTARCDEAEASANSNDKADGNVNSVEGASVADTSGDSVFKHQFEELVGLIEHEIRDLPTITCIAVFSLGIVLGRYLR